MKLFNLLLSATLSVVAQGEPVTRGISSLSPTSTRTIITETKEGTSMSTTSASSSATPSPKYPHGYPLCGIPNFDLQPRPGNTTAVIHQQVGSNVRVCVLECRADVGDVGRGKCASILFEDRYTMCLFYGVAVEETRQVDDGRFRFRSWDKDCYVG